MRSALIWLPLTVLRLEVWSSPGRSYGFSFEAAESYGLPAGIEEPSELPGSGSACEAAPSCSLLLKKDPKNRPWR